MRNMVGVMVATALALGTTNSACGDRKEGAAPRTQGVPRPAERAREQSYGDKVAALKRLVKEGELAAGVTAARELVDDHRLDAEGWVVIATAYQVVGNGKEALRAAKTAVEKDPHNASAWVAIGAAQRTLGAFSDAEGALKRALELEPASRAARFNLAGIAADRGQHELARRELTTLVEADPDDFETRFLLATICLTQKELGPAREQLARIVERYPQHFKAQRALAALAWAEGNYKRAFERATIAARLSNDDAETARILEASFYIVAAARLVCEAGARPWPADKVIAVLTRLEEEDRLAGAARFVELDQRFAGDAVVQGRVARAVTAAGCALPTAGSADAGSMTAPVGADVHEQADPDAAP